MLKKRTIKLYHKPVSFSITIGRTAVKKVAAKKTVVKKAAKKAVVKKIRTKKVNRKAKATC